MKRILFTTIGTFFISLAAFSQGEMDALRYSTNDLMGTARSVGMGGAFGALGGDISGIAINPAGIGVYKSSEVVTTMNFRNNKSETQLNAGSLDKSKFSFSFDNMAFVGAVPLNNDDVPFINFGFTYNRLKNFDQTYSMRSTSQKKSVTDLMANNAFGIRENDLANNNFGLPYEEWLAVLGFNSYLIDPDGVNESGQQLYKSVLPSGHRIDNILHVKEKGYIHSYDFNAGTMISDIVSFGVTISVTDLDYRVNSFYDESFDADNGYSVINSLKTEGSGIQVKTGLIFKPVNELRIGVAYHSPTWYNMTNYFSSAVDHNIRGYASTPVDPSAERYTPGIVSTDVYTRDYDFKTPDKWTFSLAGIINQIAIISLDYELTNYSNMKFDNPDGGFNVYDSDQNQFIKEDFKNSSTIRVGAEIRFTPQFTGRVGYAWVQSPIEDVLRDGSFEASYSEENKDFHVPAMAGPISHFSLPKDANYFTYGLGYRFTPQFYGDIAFVMKNQKSDLYAFGGADKATLKNNMFSGVLTFGYRF